jgi:hypothetical protein
VRVVLTLLEFEIQRPSVMLFKQTHLVF